MYSLSLFYENYTFIIWWLISFELLELKQSYVTNLKVPMCGINISAAKWCGCIFNLQLLQKSEFGTFASKNSNHKLSNEHHCKHPKRSSILRRVTLWWFTSNGVMQQCLSNDLLRYKFVIQYFMEILSSKWMIMQR